MKRLLFLFLLMLCGCTGKPNTYTVVKYEWGASKSLDNVSTALYTIRHGKTLISAECIGTGYKDGFRALDCSPPLPIGTEFSMRPDGHELICSVGNRDVHLEVNSEEIK